MAEAGNAPWRVVLIEDNADTRLFFEQSILQHPELALTASFEALQPALAWFREHTADLLLTDLHLPDGSGLSALRQVGHQHPQCDMLVISMFGDEDHVVASIEAGAVGYVHKDAGATNIAQVLLDIKRGASPISPMVARGVLARLRQFQEQASSTPPELFTASTVSPTTAPPPPACETSGVSALTQRERQVLELLSRGYAYAEIAQLCEVSLHTVQGHIKNIYGKLAVRSRGEAVFEASRLGLIDSMGAPR